MLKSKGEVNEGKIGILIRSVRLFLEFTWRIKLVIW